MKRLLNRSYLGWLLWFLVALALMFFISSLEKSAHRQGETQPAYPKSQSSPKD